MTPHTRLRYTISTFHSQALQSKKATRRQVGRIHEVHCLKAWPRSCHLLSSFSCGVYNSSGDTWPQDPQLSGCSFNCKAQTLVLRPLKQTRPDFASRYSELACRNRCHCSVKSVRLAVLNSVALSHQRGPGMRAHVSQTSSSIGHKAPTRCGVRLAAACTVEVAGLSGFVMGGHGTIWTHSWKL